VHTQPPIQWVPGDFSPEIMHEAVTSIQTQSSELSGAKTPLSHEKGLLKNCGMQYSTRKSTVL